MKPSVPWMKPKVVSTVQAMEEAVIRQNELQAYIDKKKKKTLVSSKIPAKCSSLSYRHHKWVRLADPRNSVSVLDAVSLVNAEADFKGLSMTRGGGLCRFQPHC